LPYAGTVFVLVFGKVVPMVGGRLYRHDNTGIVNDGGKAGGWNYFLNGSTSLPQEGNDFVCMLTHFFAGVVIEKGAHQSQSGWRLLCQR
jgi:hypothetical protein